VQLPKGNPLIERVTLPFPDINIMINNLEEQGFTGYARMELYRLEGVVFFLHGGIIRAMEIGDNSVQVFPYQRVMNKVKKKEVPVSTYILASQMVGVLSNCFAFQPVYQDHPLKKKEWEKVHKTLEEESYTGVIDLKVRDTSHSLILDRGKIFTDNFTREYGQILCGTEAVHELLARINRDGATLGVMAEKAQEIEARKQIVQQELERIRQLIVKGETGIFRSKDELKVEEGIMREWGVSAKSFNVEVELPDGDLIEARCSAGRKLGGYIAVPAQVMKKYNLNDGEVLSVRPMG